MVITRTVTIFQISLKKDIKNFNVKSKTEKMIFSVDILPDLGIEYLKSNFKYFCGLLEMCCIFLISIDSFCFSGQHIPKQNSRASVAIFFYKKYNIWAQGP